MKNTILSLLVFSFVSFIYGQTDEVTFPRLNYDFDAMPRTQLSPMSIKLFDDYHTSRPNGAIVPGNNKYGTLLAIYGYVNHWESNLYFGSNKRMYFRTSNWSGGTAEDGTTGGFHGWRTILDNKSNIESTGILKLSGSGDHYLSNGKLGIGTTSPYSYLHIKSNESNGFIDRLALSVIEGTDARVQILSTNSGSNGSALSLTNENSSWTLHQKTASVGNRFDIGYRYSEQREDIAAFQKVFFSILPNGNVGIGTTNPTEKLTVKGTIRATKVEIRSDGEIPASDYVFEPDYKLRSLEEVETFVKENRHLPEVPSAAEFKENGYSIGEMDDILLRKVEELTLYMIELKKENQLLKKEIEELKNL